MAESRKWRLQTWITQELWDDKPALESFLIQSIREFLNAPRVIDPDPPESHRVLIEGGRVHVIAQRMTPSLEVGGPGYLVSSIFRYRAVETTSESTAAPVSWQNFTITVFS